jgi:hypothetical protein
MHMPVDSADCCSCIESSSKPISRHEALAVWVSCICCGQLFLKIMIHPLRHNVNLWSTLTLEDMVRFQRVKTFYIGSTASGLPKKNPGCPRSVHNPENVERVWVALQQSPCRSARQHSVALGMSDRSVRRTLHTFIHSKFKWCKNYCLVIWICEGTLAPNYWKWWAHYCNVF